MLPEDCVTARVDSADGHASLMAVVEVYRIVEESVRVQGWCDGHVLAALRWVPFERAAAVVAKAFLFCYIHVTGLGAGLAAHFFVVLWFHYSLLIGLDRRRIDTFHYLY